MKLLIVDDNRDSAEALAKHAQLSVSGIDIKVFFAESLKEARAITVQEQPNLTFLDVSLPDATPLQVRDSIIHFTPPVIVVSGFSPTAVLVGMDKPVSQAMIEAGARDYFQKSSDRYWEQISSAWIAVLVGDNIERVKDILHEDPSCLTTPATKS